MQREEEDEEEEERLNRWVLRGAPAPSCGQTAARSPATAKTKNIGSDENEDQNEDQSHSFVFESLVFTNKEFAIAKMAHNIELH